jgi:catechol 2,3-dioxygenase
MTTLPADIAFGPICLAVADLSRSVAFYQDVLGLRLHGRDGRQAVLGAAAPLVRLVAQPGARPVQRAAGLYHVALRVPQRADLADVLAHLLAIDAPLLGAADHIVSEALYLADPDGHGIEVYHDRPRSAWYDARGRFLLTTQPLDGNGLLALADGRRWAQLPDASDIGHVHLQVGDVAAHVGFYTDVIGFAVMARIAGAAFIAAGGYHHHLGLNSWAGRDLAAAPADAARLLEVALCMPAAALDALAGRLAQAGVAHAADGAALVCHDPAGNRWVFWPTA